MKRLFQLLPILLILIALSPAAAAQELNPKATAMTDRIHKLDILNQILPVLMTKAQINKILSEMEKARAIAKEVEKAEFAELEKIDPKVTEEIKKCEEKGTIPDEKLMDEISALGAKFLSRRQQQANANAVNVFKVMKETLNDGQLKAAALSLNPKLLDRSADPESMTQDAKLILWIKFVLMDPIAYEVMIELSKKAK